MDIFSRERPFEGVPWELRRGEPAVAEEPLHPAVEAVLTPSEEPREPPAPEPLPEWGERALRLLEDL